jgi:diguanylate cyclase (GGDEF)-like protein
MSAESNALHYDALTGCFSRDQLLYDLGTEIKEAGRSNGRYQKSVLCFDIDNFAAYLDHNGFGTADAVLIQIGDRLRSLYGDCPVYRFGGDEFVVVGTNVLQPGFSAGVPVRLKHAIVNIDIHVEKGRHHRASGWVLLHIHAGVVRAHEDGILIECRDRDR